MGNGREGFTLVELVIVVAIIGLLSALAVPAWGVMVAKSRQVEARESLSTIYALETAYNTENNGFGSLIDINFAPEGATHYSYCVSADSSDCIAASAPLTDASGGSAGCPTCRRPPRGPNLYFFSTSAFEAQAQGTISGAPSPHDLDSWLMDQSKDLVNNNTGY
jgi:type IV pilus assembly protein PilE